MSALRTALVAAGLVAAVATGAVATAGLTGADAEPAARRTGPAASTPVTRQTLVEAVTLSGALSYGPAVPVAATGPGTVTWLPAVGAAVRRGGTLFRIDEAPVLLLYGALPMYRPLTTGVTGADVRQLQRNLRALGYRRGVVADGVYSAGTADAVQRWQRDLGLPPTGAMEKHRIVYAAGPVRVAERKVRVGAAAEGDLVTYTGSTRTVEVTADRSQLRWAAAGVPVTLTGPAGNPVPGSVTAVSAAAAPEAGASKDEAAPAPDTAETGLTATIAFAAQDAVGTVAGGLVTVRHVVRERRDVLTVPVNALLALAEGGYGVELDGGRIVAVETGLFADGRVEVTGTGLAPGVRVGVPE